MNTLKAKTKITCNTCGCTMKRIKTIKVYADNKESAIKEANKKIEQWKKSLVGQNCKTCQSVLNSIEDDKYK